MKPKVRARAAELNAEPELFQFKTNMTYLIKSKAQKYHILRNQHKKIEENNDLWIIKSICTICAVCCGSFNLFYCISLLVVGYKIIQTHSIFQNYMFCVIYCNLNESQLNLRMMSFCTILKFSHLHQQ